MGNIFGGRRKVKVMRIDGSSFKLKPPVAVRDVLRDHPGYDLLDAEEVKQLGVRAKPLDANLPLKPNKLYFLVDLPKLPASAPPPPTDHRQIGTRRVRSAINMSAKDRLENLMLSRRAVSDLSSFARPPSSAPPGGGGVLEAGEDGTMRVRMRLPKAQVAKLMGESRNAAEAAEKIMELCVAGQQEDRGGAPAGGSGGLSPATGREKKEKRMRFVLPEDQIIA